MPSESLVESGIDRDWLLGEASRDPIAHAWAVWDLDHGGGRVRFTTLREHGRPRAYLLVWYGLPSAPVVHWVGVPEDPRLLLRSLPERPLIAIVPAPVADAVAAARPPVVSYPLLVLALDPTAPEPARPPPEVRRLRRDDAPALERLAKSNPELLTAAYLAIDPGVEQIWGVMDERGSLRAVARVQLALPKVWMIGGIYTAPDFRGRGLGTAVTSAATLAALAAGATPALVVREDNASARHIYASLGYRLVDHRVWIDAGVDRRP